MAKGRKTGGRRRGTPNNATREAKEFCASIIDDPRYQRNLRERAIKGTLSPAVEAMLWHHARGVPNPDHPARLRIATGVPQSVEAPAVRPSPTAGTPRGPIG